MRVAPKPGRLASSGGRLALAAIVLLLTVVAPARADVVETIIDRCTHGESLSGFSQRAYNDALKELLADTEEYTGCSQEIRQAEIEAAAHPHGGASGGGASGVATAAPVALPATPADLQSIASAQHKGSGPVRVGGEVVRPGVVHANVASALSTLPAPLLAVLALMLACLLILAGSFLRKRVRGGHSD